MKYSPEMQQVSPTTFVSGDEDPWFRFEGPFIRGTYRMEFRGHVDDDVPPTNMKLYYAHLNGDLTERNSVMLGRLPREKESDRVRLHLHFHEDVPYLRFDPLQTKGEFEFSDMRIYRVDLDGERLQRESIRGRGRALKAWLKGLIHPAEFIPTRDIDVGKPPYPSDHVDYVGQGECEPGPPKAEVLEDRPHTVGFELPFAVPLNLKVDARLRPTLNVLVPGMAMRSMSGGPNTVINLTYRLAKMGVPVRYFSTDVPADTDLGPLWQHIGQLTGISERLPNVEIVDAHDRSETTAIGLDDVFFGTAWWTVQMVKHALPLVSTRRFVYLIQDFEPGFIAWSTAYALALETYGMDFRAIICSELLAEHLCANRIGRFADPRFIEQCVVFEPAIDTQRFHFEERGWRKRRLLFYARPNAPRNMYELGLAALHAAVERGLFNPREWELLFMGEDLPPVDLGRGVTIQSNPWLDYDNYAATLRQSDVGLSLMLSPHTSYPPLELAACGATVVTNTFGVKSAKRLREISGNIVPVDATLEAIVAGLAQAVTQSKNESFREEHARLHVPSHWDDVFNPILPRVCDMWRECQSTRMPTNQMSRRAA